MPNQIVENNGAYNEHDLLVRVAEGDEKAFRQVFDAYRQKIYSFAMHLTHSEPLAEDIVQEVFLRIWKSREKLVDVAYFNAYLKTFARNVAINQLKTIAVEKLALKSMPFASDEDANSTVSPLIRKEYEKVLHQAIEGLPPQRKKVYLLSRQMGLKNQEIADQLQISIYTVKEQLANAMKHIRSSLEGHIELVVVTAIAAYLS